MIAKIQINSHVAELLNGSFHAQKKSQFELDCLVTAIEATEQIGYKKGSESPLFKSARSDCFGHGLTFEQWCQNHKTAKFLKTISHEIEES